MRAKCAVPPRIQWPGKIVSQNVDGSQALPLGSNQGRNLVITRGYNQVGPALLSW